MEPRLDVCQAEITPIFREGLGCTAAFATTRPGLYLDFFFLMSALFGLLFGTPNVIERFLKGNRLLSSKNLREFSSSALKKMGP